MMQKIMKCGFIGGFILFIWGPASWTILPWQKNQIKSFKNQKDVRFTIRDNAPESGLYTIPNMNVTGEEYDEARAQMAEGPFVFAAVAANGKSSGMVGGAVQNLIVKVIAACLVAWLLFQTKISDYNGAVKFVTVIGLVIGISATLPYVIWFGFPGTFAISGIIEAVIGWFFAGLGMAKMAHK